MKFTPDGGTQKDIQTTLWLDLVRSGEVRVPEMVARGASVALLFALRSVRHLKSIDLHVDTTSGDHKAFDSCKELLRRRNDGQMTNVFVDGIAGSIGLSFVAVGTHRVATPDSTFIVHGEQYRPCDTTPRHETGALLEDHYAADWLARFTTLNYVEWLGIIEKEVALTFGPEQAIEWGVIDAIEGVL